MTTSVDSIAEPPPDSADCVIAHCNEFPGSATAGAANVWTSVMVRWTVALQAVLSKLMEHRLSELLRVPRMHGDRPRSVTMNPDCDPEAES